MAKYKTIKIVKDFSGTLGGRYKTDGPYSGELFREQLLRPAFDSLKDAEILLIDFDGTYGYPTSFLEEAFGGLARLFKPEEVLEKLKFKSDEEPGLIEEVENIIKNATE